MAVRDGVGGASFNTIAAKNTTRVVDVVDTGVAFTRRDAARVGILRGLNIDAVRRTGRRAQKTAHTFLQARLVAMEHMDSAIARLKMHGLVRIVLRHSLPEHVLERDAETLHQGAERFADFSENRGHG